MAQELEIFPYASAQAFGAALTNRLGVLAGNASPSVSQLRRQFAYDRLLARLFTAAPQQWILKGGVSMIARLASARHTADVDIVACADSADAALEALRSAAQKDLGDFFTFRFETPRALIQGVPGLRIPTEARLGPRLFERFGVDLVTGVVITGRPEEVKPLLSLTIPGLIRPKYRLYPLVGRAWRSRRRDVADRIPDCREGCPKCYREDARKRARAREKLRRSGTCWSGGR
ncbi:hypothetical protein DMB66_56200 [Actinoplanes sp. ATCC 53533]|uniref:nucleotidyl transferase AbiEii/AbiGii toxin family protein n=1 Tax=Actinoplanes sp. ATCC 53533 TaxID=1288362 RepID=UPI000F7A0B6F|nr:nucleotidyl transferase AbiEii/AbiGii toxin family protein [Actinoplanes sp. ATCC 53533]RSM41326.1 hypothetical protein DMB66_56200 [Actinoplanes sp. ATCC 53533]